MLKETIALEEAMDVEKRNRKTPDRERTIALLGTELNYEIPIEIFKETRKLAQIYNYNLLYFSGEPFKCPFESYASANILYNFITPKIVDGLILISNLLCSYTPYRLFRERCLQFQPFPVISLGMILEGIPSVVLDNNKGMYDAVSHLITDHRYTRIAFLSGPREHPDSIERFAAFTRAMGENGLTIDQSLLLQGDYRHHSGRSAVKELLDLRGKKPGRDVQAIVCCNDYMAAGVMLELQSRGIRIPEEFALIGFDDSIISGYLTPTISTVRQSFKSLAAKAVELLIQLLEGNSVPDIVHVDSRFIPRRSCGCPDKIIKDNGYSIPEDLKEHLKKTPREFLEYLNGHLIDLEEPILMTWKKPLSSLHEKDTRDRKSGQANFNRDFGQSERTLIEETAYNTFIINKYQKMIYNTGIALIKTLDLSELLKTIIKNLPLTGIRRCSICLYENPGNSKDALPPWSGLILAFDHTGATKLPPGGLRFETSRLLPEEINWRQKGIFWVIYNLYYHHEQLGYILLESGVNDERIYSNLTRQISSTLKGALLYKESQEHTRQLAEANKIIQGLYIDLKDENLRIKAEMDVARKIQTALLPMDVSEIHHDFQFAASMLPADKVGGDYYDIALDRDGSLWLGIGDVSGHGLKPGLIMILAQTIHTTITTNLDVNPAEALVMINRVLIKNVKKRMQESDYMTCVLLKYRGKGSFQFAGVHLDLLIYRLETKSCEQIETNGMWLNVIDDITDHTKNMDFKLEIGDVLILYSDGITESRNEDREMLDIKGLMDLVVRHGEKELEEMKQGILADVLAWHKARQRDDITLVLTRRIH
ncbi:MAG: substrate-binding domain-containing protein [Spirochaetales bacterium]|nr:substrate-binding domain-containing protein [Spirochaetales bacterium]